MKRKLWLAVLAIMTLFALVIGVAACGDEDDTKETDTLQQLATPVVSISQEGLASWTAVINANGYVYKINDGTETSTDQTSVQLTNGQTITVKASGDNINFLDSAYSAPKTYTAPAQSCIQHAYGNPVWSWTGSDAAGYTAATATFTCTNGDDTQVKPATVDSSIQKQASCTENGERLYTASLTFNSTHYEDTKTVSLDKLQHNMQSVGRQEATCTEPGFTAHQACSNCTHKEGYEVLPATGHDYEVVKWTWSDEAPYTATVTFLCMTEDCDDPELEEEAVVDGGVEEGIGCTTSMVYTATVTMEFGTYTGEKTVILNGAHNFGALNAEIPATCESTGTKGYKTCSNPGCDDLYYDKDGNLISDLTLAKNPNAHTTAKTINGVQPTCTDDGHETYYQCNGCNKLFSDEAMKHPTTEEAMKIGKLNHRFEFDSANVDPDHLPTENRSAEIQLVCKNDCGTTKKFTLPALNHTDYEKDGFDADCETGSLYEYTIEIDGVTFKFEIQGDDALGHESVWSYSEAGHVETCSRCTKTLSEVSHNWSNGWTPDGNVNGQHTRTTNCSQHAQQYTVSEDHNYEIGECTECGYAHVHGNDLQFLQDEDGHLEYCDVCGYEGDDVVDHTFENGSCTKCGASDPAYKKITATYNPAEMGYTNGQDIPAETVYHATVSSAKGTSTSGDGAKYYSSAFRVYGGNTITISVPNDKFIIQKITFTIDSSGTDSGKTLSTDSVKTDSFDGKVWTGSAQTVTFTVVTGNTGKLTIKKMEIEYLSPEAWGTHKLGEVVKGTPADCENTGIKDHWECENCGKWFDDQNGTKEITEPQVAPKLDHQYGSWENTGNILHHERTCTLCHKVTETEGHDTKGADGECSVCGYKSELSDAQKAQAALEALTIPETLEADYTIAKVEGITFNITVGGDNPGAIKVVNNADGSITLKITRPAATEQDASVQLIITATCGSDTTPDARYIGVFVKAEEVQIISGSFTIVASDGGAGGSYAYYTWETTNESNNKIGGSAFSMKDGNNFQFNNGKAAAYIASNLATPAPITKITMTTASGTNRAWTLLTSGKAYNVSSTSPSNPTTGTDHGKQTVTTTGTSWEVKDSNAYYFALVLTVSSASYISEIKVEYSNAATGGTTHTCQHVCTTCNKCTDTCQDPVCQDKCQGHNQGGTETPQPGETENVKLDFTTWATADKGTSAYSNCSFDKSDAKGIVWTFANGNNNGKGWNYVKVGAKNNTNNTASISTKSAISGAVHAVSINCKKLVSSATVTVKLIVASDSSFANIVTTYDAADITTTQGDITFNITSPTANLYYKLEIVSNNSTGTNGAAQINSVTYTVAKA